MTASPDVREVLERLEYWAACEVPATAADDAATIRARIDALTADLADYRTAANAEAAEVDRRGQRIANLTAEVERLRGENEAMQSDLTDYIQAASAEATAHDEQRKRAQQAEAQLAAMTERAGKDAEDAARYRWLRDEARANEQANRCGEYHSVTLEYGAGHTRLFDGDLDAAIDAIAATRESGDHRG